MKTCQEHIFVIDTVVNDWQRHSALFVPLGGHATSVQLIARVRPAPQLTVAHATQEGEVRLAGGLVCHRGKALQNAVRGERVGDHVVHEALQGTDGRLLVLVGSGVSACGSYIWLHRTREGTVVLDIRGSFVYNTGVGGARRLDDAFL